MQYKGHKRKHKASRTTQTTHTTMKYVIITSAGKNLYHEEEIVNSVDEGISILNSLYAIDKAKGMEPVWTSRVTFKSEITLPNGLVCSTRTYLKRLGDVSCRRH